MQPANKFEKLAAGAIVLAAFFGLVTALGVWAQEPPPINGDPASYVSAIAIPKTLDARLPTCFDPPNCTTILYRIDVQVKTPGFLLVDLYGARNGNSHFAKALRLSLGTRWLWVIGADDMFFQRALRAWQKDKVGVIGPFPLAEITLRPTVCANVAQAALVNVTSDAGTLIQPTPVKTVECPKPNDAGTPLPDCKITVTTPQWPKVLKCRDGGGVPFYLPRLKHGGTAVTNWRDDGGPKYKPQPKRLDPRIPPNWAEAPDAAIIKYCPPVAVGTSCP